MATLLKSIYVLKSGTSIAGHTRNSKATARDIEEERIETRGIFTEVIEHKTLFRDAKGFAGAVNQLADRYGIRSETLGAFVTDENGKARFEAELARLAGEIARFNALRTENGSENPHKITIKPYTRAWRYDTVLSDDDLRAMVAEVANEVTDGWEKFKAGNFKAVTDWLKRNQRLPAALPNLTGNMLAGAIESLRVANNAGAAAARGGSSLPVILDLPESKALNEAMEAALGWLAPYLPPVETEDLSAAK